MASAGPGLEPGRSELWLSGLESPLYLSSKAGRTASGWSRSRGLLTRRAEHLSRPFLILAPDQCPVRFPDSARRPKLLLAGPAQCASWEANSLQRLVRHWPTGREGAGRLRDATTSRTERANTPTADLGQSKLPLPSDGVWYHNPNTLHYRKSILRRGDEWTPVFLTCADGRWKLCLPLGLNRSLLPGMNAWSTALAISLFQKLKYDYYIALY